MDRMEASEALDSGSNPGESATSICYCDLDCWLFNYNLMAAAIFVKGSYAVLTGNYNFHIIRKT